MEVLYWLESIRNPVLDAFFATITHLGGEMLFIVIAIVIFWCVGKQEGYYLMTVGFFGTLLNQFLKLVCQVPRPWVRDPNFTIVEAARADATGYSFPSGHTQSITGSLGCLARCARKQWFRWLSVAVILLVALSRMYLGVHTPADVGVSLVIGTALVLGLYPLFEKSREKPEILYWVVGVLSLCSLAYVIFVETHAWPADIAPDNLASGVKNDYTLLGCGLGMLVSLFVERRYIRFDTRAVWWAQVLKTVLGLLLVLAVMEGSKPLFELLFGGHMAGRAARYFCVVVTAACIWPLTFRWFGRLGNK